VRVTPAGREARRRIGEVVGSHMEGVLATWSAPDRADLARLLARLVDDLRSAQYAALVEGTAS
jgi:DNA-binding MarR family transcriptional regulator